MPFDVAKTACERCRSQKLRCSRDIPTCTRCVDFSVDCRYPEPPDRKMIAALRAPPKARRTRITNTVNKSPTSAAQDEHSRRQNVVQTSSTASAQFLGTSGKIADIPSSVSISDNQATLDFSAEVHDFLQDVYFACQFHSALLFHRPSFTRAFEAGQVKQEVLLAIYSNAIIFLPESSSVYQQNTHLLRPLGNLKERSREWALAAGRTVLQSIDQPTFLSVQVCEIVCMYWFSVGDFKRHTIFLSIAYKIACLLELNKVHQAEPDPTTSYNDQQRWLSREAARRCFWAVWFTQCINSDNELPDAVFSDDVMELPLPISEHSYLRCRPEPRLRTLSQMQSTSGTAPVPDSSSSSAKISLFAELVGIMFYWAKVRKLVEARKRSPPSAWLTQVYELESKVTAWRSQLPSSLQYAKRSLNDPFLVNQQPMYIMMHSLYSQCRLVLHSMLVPQFSGLPLPEGIPNEVASVSARIARSSAEELSSIAADLLVVEWDPAKVPAFLGYCLYASASLHIALLHVSEQVTIDRARTHLLATLKLLRSLKQYWSILEKLWARINLLYVDAMRRGTAENVGQEGIARHQGSSQTNPTDLDHLAREVRDPGQLSEPLANSVLEYSLRRLDDDGTISEHPSCRATMRDYHGQNYLDAFIDHESSTSQPPHQFAYQADYMDLNVEIGPDQGFLAISNNQLFSDPAQLLGTPQDVLAMFPDWADWAPDMQDPQQFIF